MLDLDLGLGCDLILLTELCDYSPFTVGVIVRVRSRDDSGLIELGLAFWKGSTFSIKNWILISFRPSF